MINLKLSFSESFFYVETSQFLQHFYLVLALEEFQKLRWNPQIKSILKGIFLWSHLKFFKYIFQAICSFSVLLMLIESHKRISLACQKKITHSCFRFLSCWEMEILLLWFMEELKRRRISTITHSLFQNLVTTTKKLFSKGILYKRALYQNSLYELKTHFWQIWGCWFQIWQQFFKILAQNTQIKHFWSQI